MGFDLYIEDGKKALEALSNPIEVGRKVKNVILKFWPNARVYLFGSSISGKYTASSDIDVLVVVENVSYEEALKVKARVYMTLNYPIEIHVVAKKHFTNWYMRFIGEDEILEI